MLKVIMTLLIGTLSLFASSDSTVEIPNLTMTWVGFATLIIFIIGYYWIAWTQAFPEWISALVRSDWVP